MYIVDFVSQSKDLKLYYYLSYKYHHIQFFFCLSNTLKIVKIYHVVICENSVKVSKV